MKTIAEIIGGAQTLLDINFDLQGCFEEQLSDEHKTFLHVLRVLEEVMPSPHRAYAGTRRRPYPYLPFVRSSRRIPIIEPNRRNNAGRPPLEPAKRQRYKIRTTVERAYSHLKGSLLPRALYVKGSTKVTFVLMSAVLVLAALKYLQFFT